MVNENTISKIFQDAKIVDVTLIGTSEHKFFRLDIETSHPIVLSIQLNVPDVEEALAQVDIPMWDGSSFEEALINAALDQQKRLAPPSTETPQ